jgi:flagellar motor component MotA
VKITRDYYKPTAAQQAELLEAALKLKAKTAEARDRARRNAAAAAPIFGMLSVVVGVKPMDNPFVNTHIGDL